MKYLSILLFLLLGACASQPKPTHMKYSGHLQGCADATTFMLMDLGIPPDKVNPVWLDALCMELYILRLEQENIKPPMKRHNKSDMI